MPFGRLPGWMVQMVTSSSISLIAVVHITEKTEKKH
jgi:hypothetical protein